MLPIAILSTADFDARNVDVSTLRFGDSLLVREGATPAIPLRSAEEDVNGDGLKDLSLKLSMRDLLDHGALGPHTFAGSLTGSTLDGSEIVGFDRIRIVGRGAKGIPEPSTLTLAALGLSICLALIRKRDN